MNGWLPQLRLADMLWQHRKLDMILLRSLKKIYIRSDEDTDDIKLLHMESYGLDIYYCIPHYFRFSQLRRKALCLKKQTSRLMRWPALFMGTNKYIIWTIWLWQVADDGKTGRKLITGIWEWERKGYERTFVPTIGNKIVVQYDFSKVHIISTGV